MRSFENFKDIKSIQVSISSPEDILCRSHGEVINTKSINYKTMNAEKGGLFCEIIFGPMKDYECRCGAIEGIEYTGKKCNICGVEVNSPRIRRYRMGHIKLSTPVPHVWFLKIRPFYLLSLMGMRMKDMDNLFLSRSEVISTIRPRSVREALNTSRRYRILQGKKVFKGSGCEVVYNYLLSMDLSYEYLYQRSSVLGLIRSDKLKKNIYSGVNSYNNFLRSQYFLNQLKRLRILEYFLCAKRRPEWMMLQNVPVLPPELRPFLLMDNNLVVSSDLNFLYKRILERNVRLKTLEKLKESESQYVLSSFYYNELCMLQHAVDSLIENGRRGKAMTNRKQIPLKSLTHILKGKEGRFRMNLLGKRVDLSGRTVISVGPRLKMTQCGLPISIALILFKSLIFDKVSFGSFISKKILSSLVDKLKYRYKGLNSENLFVQYLHSSQVMYEIEKIASSNPLLLNRAPTLHKLNIQSFQPVLINSKALQLHPLVCSSFNADFDGDQMAVHLPLSLSSQIESRILMMTYNNILNSSNGMAVISPSQDIVFGLYYATQLDLKASTIRTFYNMDEVRNAYMYKTIGLHTPIYLYIKISSSKTKYVTSVGRVLMYNFLPNKNIDFSIINKSFTKKAIQELIHTIYFSTNYEDFLFFLDNLMAYGFYHAHMSGISLSLDDVSIPSLKPFLLKKAMHKYNIYTQNKNKIIDTTVYKEDTNRYFKQSMVGEWFRAQENLTSLILKDVYESNRINESPSIYMLIHSGARGSILQMRQLSGIRGLMVKPSGDLIEMPISANFKEGLNVLEYFYSTHGARKGVIDTSIRTATSGYLTRRLVHATQDLIISEEDCGTERNILLNPEFSLGKESKSIIAMAYGRVNGNELRDLATNKLLIAKNNLIDLKKIDKLKNVEELYIRSPLICESKEGICKACYGSNMSSGKLVSIGEAVGILSAQSIGEPGTQLTMRTFHMGGVLLGGQSSNTIRSLYDGRVYIKQMLCIPLVSENALYNVAINVAGSAELIILGEDNTILSKYFLPLGSVVYIKDGSKVSKNDILFQWNPYYEPVVYKNIIPSYVNYSQVEYKDKKIQKLFFQPDLDLKNIYISHTTEVLKETFIELNPTYFYNSKDILIRSKGEKVKLGDIILLYPRNQEASGDITGGLSKISQLFECSYTNKQKSLNRKNGWYLLRSSISTNDIKWNLSLIHPKLKENFTVFSGHSLRVRTTSFLQKGSTFLSSPISMLDVLSVFGPARAIYHLKREILSIYQTNGVTLHDKHIELILKRIFGKIEIIERGSTPYVSSEIIELKEFLYQNILSLSKGLLLAKGKVSTRGVTSISLDSRSFLSAASFQNTAQVLTSSAILARTDNLTGLGENVILGRLAPIGSASFYR